MVGAVVLHDVEDRDLVVRRRPHRARAEHEVAVAAERDGEAAVLLVGERRADRGRQVIADAGAAGDAVPLVRLLEVPQPMHPAVADRGADHRPVLVLDLVVDLGAHPRGGDRACIPADRGVGLRLLDHGEMRLGELFAAVVEGRLAAVVDQALDRLGEHRQRGFAVAGDVEIDVLPAAEILIVGFQIQVAHAERDDLGARLVGRLRACARCGR